MADFKKIRAWHAAEQLAVDVYRVAGEMRGRGSTIIRDQLMRAAMSVPTNIVEGSAHASDREYARFLRYALASTSEVEGHVSLGSRLGLISTQDAKSLVDTIEAVRKMLTGLIKTLNARSESSDTGQSGPGNRKAGSAVLEIEPDSNTETLPANRLPTAEEISQTSGVPRTTTASG